jgi:large subunit ribosomal protein L18
MFSRRRTGKTDYRQRLALLKSRKPRLVVRVGIKNINCQIITYDGNDKTITEIRSLHLKKYGWLGHGGNMPACYLTGLLAGFTARKKGISEAVLDIGLKTSVKSSSVYAAAAGAKDAGLKIPVGNVLPLKERIEGRHIAAYAAFLKKDKKKYEKNFSQYIKNNLDPEKLPEHFEEVKNKIINDFRDLPGIEEKEEGDEWEEVK